MRVLGIDPGSARTGLAIADDDIGVATPLRTIEHAARAQVLREIAALVREEGVELLVVGLPLSLDGREGDAARRARRFADELHTQLGARVVLWDERLSTALASRALQQQGVRGAARKRVVDQAAATVLLQSYLDHLRDRPWPPPSQEPPPRKASGPTPRRRRE